MYERTGTTDSYGTGAQAYRTVGGPALRPIPPAKQESRSKRALASIGGFLLIAAFVGPAGWMIGGISDDNSSFYQGLAAYGVEIALACVVFVGAWIYSKIKRLI